MVIEEAADDEESALPDDLAVNRMGSECAYPKPPSGDAPAPAARYVTVAAAAVSSCAGSGPIVRGYQWLRRTARAARSGAGNAAHRTWQLCLLVSKPSQTGSVEEVTPLCDVRPCFLGNVSSVQRAVLEC